MSMPAGSSRVLVTFAIVAALTQDYVAGDEYRPGNLSKVYPSVRWVDGAAGETTEFVLASSQRHGSENWVSFAFADRPSMLATQLVVDCYDLGGLSQMGTSRNSLDATRTNRDSPGDKAKLTNSTVSVHDGVYNCTFLMKLPSAAAYVIMAEGKLHPGANTSSPRKMGHGSRMWASTRAYPFGSDASNATAAVDGAVASADDDTALTEADSPAVPAVAADPRNGLAGANDGHTSGSVTKAAAASVNQMTPSNTSAAKSAAISLTPLVLPDALANFFELAQRSRPADAKVAGYNYLVQASLAVGTTLVVRASRQLAGLM